MGIFDKKFTRTTGEIRFRPTLSSTEGVVTFAKILEDKFPHWRLQSENNVTLFDDKKKRLIQIRHNGIFFLNQGDESNEVSIDFLKTIYDELIKTTNISEFIHLGARRRCVYESRFNIKDLTDLTFKKFYGNLASLKLISGETINDTSFILDATKDGFQTHVQIGPSQSEQADSFFEGQFPEERLEKTKAYLLLDVDVFLRKDFQKDTNIEELRKVEKLNLEIVNSYLDFISEK